MNKKYIIKVKQLELMFEDGTTFSFHDLNIARGKITGVIGANGSGKTTLVEAILGLKTTTKADVSIDGVDQKQYFSSLDSRLNLGSQLQVFAFSEYVKVKEMVSLHKSLYGQQSKRIYDDLAIDEIANKRLDKLSGGQKQRVNLYMALAHMPKLITLDEPSAALDKSMAEKLIKLLKYLVAEQDCSILLITHHPYELDICDEVITIHAGTNAYHESRKDFIEKIIGNYHAQIFIGEDDDGEIIKAQIDNITHVKQHFSQNGQIDIYGEAAMEGDFLALIKQYGIKSYAFAQSNSADILKISTSFAG